MIIDGQGTVVSGSIALGNTDQITVVEQVAAAQRFIASALEQRPEVLLVLGSGLGGLAEKLRLQKAFDFAQIPHFKSSGAPGHAGRLLFGELFGKNVAIMQGRLHAYEGHSAAEIVFPIRVLAALGAKTLLVTNASGGINDMYQVGDIMLISDHINFTGMNPLTLSPAEGLSEFVDMTYAYSPALIERAIDAADSCDVDLKRGIYLGLRGPCFETPAEIRAFRTWGADAVGMSTVLEVIAANALGMEVCGLSLISNKAAGMLDVALSGDDVLEASKIAAAKMEALIAAILAGEAAKAPAVPAPVPAFATTATVAAPTPATAPTPPAAPAPPAPTSPDTSPTAPPPQMKG